MSLFLALLHRLLTNQEMMMDQLKVILKTMQKMGEPARGQEPLERDILPLKDPTSLLGLEKRLREEADLKNKMVNNTLPYQLTNILHKLHRHIINLTKLSSDNILIFHSRKHC